MINDASLGEGRTASPPASTPSELVAIPGDTYAVKAELKLLGAVWDKSERLWRIAPEKLAQARALVEHQALYSVASSGSGGGGIDLETLSDPFEQDGDGPRYALLSEADGDVFAAKDALKAIGANWDKTNRAWKVREERADYARAIVASVTKDKGGEDKDVSHPPAKAKTTTTKAEPGLNSANVATPPKPAPTGTKTTATMPEEKRAETVESKAGADAAKMLGPTGMVLGGLWRRRGPDGKVYLSGYLSDGVEIRIVGNEQRTSEEGPSHTMYLVPIVLGEE